MLSLDYQDGPRYWGKNESFLRDYLEDLQQEIVRVADYLAKSIHCYEEDRIGLDKFPQKINQLTLKAFQKNKQLDQASNVFSTAVPRRLNIF